MKLADDLRRLFLSEDSLESHEPTGGDPTPTSSEDAARYEQSRIDVLLAIRDDGWYRP